MAVGTQVAEVLEKYMDTDTGEFPRLITRNLGQWVAYWHHHSRVDPKREFHADKKEFVTVVLVSLAMEPKTTWNQR